MRQEKRKKRRREKAKRKSQDYCVTFKLQKFAFCACALPELRKLIFCIWIRTPRNVRPANSFVVIFSSLQPDKTRKPLDQLQNSFFGKIPIFFLRMRITRTSQTDILHLDQAPRNVRPANGFVAIFSSLQPDKTRKPLNQLQNAFFGKIPRGEWVKHMAVVES